MMRTLTMLLRWIYGLFYASIGSAVSASGVFDVAIATTCLLGGLLLLPQRTAPLGIAVLAPLVTGIFLFHVFLTGAWPWGCIHFGLLLVMAWLHRSAFRPLWNHPTNQID